MRPICPMRPMSPIGVIGQIGQIGRIGPITSSAQPHQVFLIRELQFIQLPILPAMRQKF